MGKMSRRGLIITGDRSSDPSLLHVTEAGEVKAEHMEELRADVVKIGARQIELLELLQKLESER